MVCNRPDRAGDGGSSGEHQAEVPLDFDYMTLIPIGSCFSLFFRATLMTKNFRKDTAKNMPKNHLIGVEVMYRQ